MSDFAFLYRGRDTNASPDQMQKRMEKWRAWFKQLGEKGHLKDIGHPLENAGKVVKGMSVVKKIHVAPAKGQSLTPPVRILGVSRKK